MLIWKTQNLDSAIASVRYRCILPARALEKKGVKSLIYGRRYPLPLHSGAQAIIFVKSFSNDDVKSCNAAHILEIPIILDLCDNIFIDNYGKGITQFNQPRDNFLRMAKWATAIVTTGPELKCVIEQHLGESHCPVWIIPDGCETLEDVEYALKVNTWKRWMSLLKWNPAYLGLEIMSYVIDFGQRSLIQIIHQWEKSKRGLSRVKIFLKRLLIQLRGDADKESCATKEKLDKSWFLSGFKSEAAEESNNKSALLVSGDTTSISEATRKNLVEQFLSFDKSRLQKLSIVNQSRITCQENNNKSLKTILWFGHYGSSYSHSGLINILDVSAAIENISKEIPLRLLVVSNNYEKYLDLIDPMPFSTAYRAWHPTEIYHYIKSSDVVILPNSKTPFALAKSANRAVLALSLGVPVVATCIPAMRPFKDCMLFDDWEENLRKYLKQSELISNHLNEAQVIIETTYQSEAIAEQWLSLIGSICYKSND